MGIYTHTHLHTHTHTYKHTHISIWMTDLDCWSLLQVLGDAGWQEEEQVWSVRECEGKWSMSEDSPTQCWWCDLQEIPWGDERAEVFSCSNILLSYFLLFSRKSFDENQIKKDIDEEFLNQFLKNGNVSAPTESLLIPTSELRRLTDSLRHNKTFCFKTEPGTWGWCATCKVRRDPETG